MKKTTTRSIPTASTRVPSESLYRACDPALLDFETTQQVESIEDAFGQQRAVEAIRFGTSIEGNGYNLFVLGDSGTGRHSLLRKLLSVKSAEAKPPSDWCYVNNFDEPRRPNALQLPAGRGAMLRADMQNFVRELGPAISSAFEADAYRTRIEAIQEEFGKREEDALQSLGQDAMQQGVVLMRTPQGFGFAPVSGEQPMKPDDFNALPEQERSRIAKIIEGLQEELHRLMHQFPLWRREMQQRVKDASRDALGLAVGHLIEELKGRYADLPEVISFLDQVKQDVIETGETLREQQRADGDIETLLISGSLSVQRYLVNLVVDNGATTGAPMIFEDNPTHPNLVGRVDQIAHMGALVTHFTLIKAGALHRANGGYLIVDAARVLYHPYAWEGLKRALKANFIEIESLGQIFGWVSALPLEPEPIPLNVKVALVGERLLYYLLSEYDPDFQALFKVAADMEAEAQRDDAAARGYGRLVAAIAREQNLLPFDKHAVARLFEQASRSASDAEKISTHMRSLSDLMRESDHECRSAGHTVVTRENVEHALAAQIRRADRLREKMLEATLRNTFLIATDGAHAGQVNGLAAVLLGSYTFAHPIRITATARLGEGDVVDIERETELGGALHSKGVMILSSFLAARFARNMPFSLNASLVFEQSYGAVEGDSASLAELCALLSALAGVPVRQNFAVTGSVNQYGLVQPIGAVNEKIEGFFDLCKARGLTGDQGVLIPTTNVKHLMLRQEVVEASAAGKFHIHAVSNVDQAIEILTGVAAGEPDEKGRVPAGTINYLVAAQLAELAAQRQAFGAGAQGRRRAKKRK